MVKPLWTEPMFPCNTKCSTRNATIATTHEPLHAQNEETNDIDFLQPYTVAAGDAPLEISTTVITAVLSLDEHLSQSNISCVPKCCYQSVYCCIIRHFLVRTRIAKCFTNSSKQFRCEVIFENEHTYCSWIHHVRTRTALRNWREQRLSNKFDPDLSVTGRLGESITPRWTWLIFQFAF
jgi:hypothetical protein